MKSWSKEPELLENEDWSALTKLAASVSRRKSGNNSRATPATVMDCSNHAQVSLFRVDNLPENRILGLFAESLELLELRDPRRDFRATAWQYVHDFMQEQDNLWWISAGAAFILTIQPQIALPARIAVNFQTCAPRVTYERRNDVRPIRTAATTIRNSAAKRPQHGGRNGETPRKGRGVPSPSYQWFTVDRAGNGQIITSGTDAELCSKSTARLVPLRRSRQQLPGEMSRAKSSLCPLNKKLRLSQSRPASDIQSVARSTAPSYVRSADDIDQQRRRIESGESEEHFRQGLRRRKILTICGVILVLCALAGFGGKRFTKQKHPSKEANDEQPSAQSAPVAPLASPVPTNPPAFPKRTRTAKSDAATTFHPAACARNERACAQSYGSDGFTNAPAATAQSIQIVPG